MMLRLQRLLLTLQQSIRKLPHCHVRYSAFIPDQNNGKEFSSVDFSRLTKIAQGNPDEQKIGFFGVGFYSLFSICEEPFLSSGYLNFSYIKR